MVKFKIARLLIAFWLSFVSCQKKDDTTTEMGYSPPIIENDGWNVGTLSEVGINQKKIEELETRIENNEYTGIQSVLIVKNGKLVYEQYFNGQTKNDLHPLYSVTKSFSSALLGIGIEQGFIDDLEVPLHVFFPNKQDFFTEEKKRIQLKHLLSMSSGLEWDELGSSYTNSRNSHRQMMQSPSQINFVLNQPTVAKPGQRFNYNTGLSNMIAPILEFSCKQNLRQFAEKQLFGKLNIVEYRWDTIIDSYPSTGGTFGGLRLRTRDMAKLGQLYLSGGLWNGERILSENWVNGSMERLKHVQENVAYGYHWWIRSGFKKDGKQLKEFDAAGDGGQFVFVFPELNAVVAFTGSNNTWLVEPSKMFQPITILRESIIEAIEK